MQPSAARLSVRPFRLLAFVLAAVLLLGLPAAGLGANQPQGFILFSAGADGRIGTPDDLYATGKGDVVKGAVDLASLGLAQANLVPSNRPREGGAAPVFVPASVVVTADKERAPADGRTPVTITAEVRGQDGGPAPDGTEVVFSTTLGTLSPAMARTSDGSASVALVSDTPGTAQVSASVGSVTSAAIAVEFMGITNAALCKPYWKSRVPVGSYPDSSSREFTDGKISYHFTDGLSFGYTAASLGVSPTAVGQLDIVVDLGGEFTVSGAELYSGSSPYCGYNYHYGADILEVLVSMDGATFASVGRIGTLGVDQNYLNLEFLPVQARYIKFHIEKKFDVPATYRDFLFITEGRVFGCWSP